MLFWLVLSIVMYLFCEGIMGKIRYSLCISCEIHNSTCSLLQLLWLVRNDFLILSTLPSFDI